MQNPNPLDVITETEEAEEKVNSVDVADIEQGATEDGGNTGAHEAWRIHMAEGIAGEEAVRRRDAEEELHGLDFDESWNLSLFEMPFKAEFLSKYLVCRECGSQGMEVAPTGVTCRNCGAGFARANNAINMLSDDIKVQMNIEDTDNVSARSVYDGNGNMIITHVANAGGMVLDCGAGKRRFRHPNLVQLEVVPYDNIDILAVNQELPFADNVFDAVLSMDVLEHVNDPVTSMKELARVLKPGGILYLDIPFLQAEHGYPHHYFNCTRMGIRQLVRGMLEPEAHIVPMSGQPIATLQQILSVYARNLPEDVRGRFMGMSVGELLTGHLHDWLKHEIVYKFPPEARWLIASTTQGIFRKPMNPDTIVPARTHDLRAHMLPAYTPQPLDEDGNPDWTRFDAVVNHPFYDGPDPREEITVPAAEYDEDGNPVSAEDSLDGGETREGRD